MHRFTSSLVLNIRSARNKWTTLLRAQSSQVQNKEQQQEQGEPVKADGIQRYDEVKISTKIQKKLPALQPLLKNFFVGKVENSLMAFPEVIPRDDIQKLQKEIQVIRDHFENLDVDRISATQTVGKEEKDEVVKLGLYGINVPQHLGGRGYTFSESLIASEPETASADIATMLASHRVVVDILQKHGTQEQIDRFLPILASGTGAATIAVYERTVPQETLFNTKAVYDDTEKKWVLNGEKSFVVNGKDAKYFLVVAETEKLDVSGDIVPGITILMVDGTSPGIKRGPDLFTLGCKGSEFTTITFESVQIPESCVIGQSNQGAEIAFSLLKFHRLRMSLVTLGLMKKLIGHLSQHCIATKQGGVPLKDMEITGVRLSRLVCKAYSLEAMLYYTGGLIDEFDNQDVDLEIAALKFYSLDCLLATATAPIDFMGPVSLLSDQPTHGIVTNAIQLYTHGESRESLTLYTGLLGLQHAGMLIHGTVKKERNPLLHPTYMLGKLFERVNIENPKPQWRLNEELHPSLEIPSQLLEQSIARLKLCTEMLLTRHGSEVIQKHSEIGRIAEIISLVYAMFATLSRASRSHCIGLQHSDYELQLSVTVCREASTRVKQLATEIGIGEYSNNDLNHMKIAKQIFKSKGFFPTHPTTYNF